MSSRYAGPVPLRYTYLGPEGTFSEQALRTLPEVADAAVTAARSVPEALDAVRVGEADAALVPLENSVGGAVAVTLDELASGAPLMITREVVLPVQFVLGARAGVELEQLGTIAAHPQAAAQCRNWLRKNAPGATVVEVLSNAAAAVGAATGEYDAGICAPIGADRHGLTLLGRNIADHADAVTRFALVSRPATPAPPTGDDVTSLVVFIAQNRVGALLQVLTEFALRGVNLTRIESRPTGERLGRYLFFFDCEGHVAEARLGEALMGLHRVSADVRFLGSYPRARLDNSVGRAEFAPGTTDADYAEATGWLSRLRAGDL
ncbi:prephenate dehydratase [Luedemannella flava]|uniref:Prephenate dehydratase n=1 Tax=Luedemannella flava TaxID=349316 RepID=A0ABN2LEV4_9ACTN